MATPIKDSTRQKDIPMSADGVPTPRRIIKKMPEMVPLEPERRYVQPEVAHVSVFTGFFSWALRSNRFGKRAGRQVKLSSRSFGSDGLNAPTRQARGQAKFTNYFAFGTEKDLRPRDQSESINVHRNRVLFLSVLAVVIVYSLIWITR